MTELEDGAHRLIGGSASIFVLVEDSEANLLNAGNARCYRARASNDRQSLPMLTNSSKSAVMQFRALPAK